MSATRSLLSTVLLVSTVLSTTLVGHAQPTAPRTVPRLVPVSGVFQPSDGTAPAPVERVTFGIYADESGGSPLWQETQTLTIDESGRYSAMLGLTEPDGLPVEIFASGDARWLGIRVERPGEIEGARVRLTMVPYAIRAADADTLGGRPASAYMLAPRGEGDAGDPVTAAATGTSGLAPAAINPGLTNRVAKYVDNADSIAASQIEEDGDGVVGMTGGQGSGIAPGTGVLPARLNVRFSNADGRQTGLSLRNDNGSAGAYSGMQMYDHTGALGVFQGFNNNSKEYRINNVAPNGTISFRLGGVPRFTVRNDGDIDISTGTFRRSGTRLLYFPGAGNTGLGANALTANGSGIFNTAIGDGALAANTTGNQNVALGAGALLVNTTGINNVALGESALRSAVAANRNTAVGQSALNVATSSFNTAVGAFALDATTTGNSNTGVGDDALGANTNGYDNVALGRQALSANVSGIGNVAAGRIALWNNTSGLFNAAVGLAALASLTTGSNNVALGASSGTQNSTGSYNIYIGHNVLATSSDESRTIRIGDLELYVDATNQTRYKYDRFFTGGIYNGALTVGDRIPVYVSETGQLGYLASSRRYKEDIQDIGDVSANVMKLRPVSFRYRQDARHARQPVQYGLIAEEVADVYPELVMRSASGEIETVHYDLVNALLLNEVQKQHRELETQRATIDELTKRLAALERLLTTEKK
jgi:hypothetical protein